MQQFVVKSLEFMHDVADRWHLIGVTADDEIGGIVKVARDNVDATLAILGGRSEYHAKFNSHTLGIRISDVHSYRPMLNFGFKLRAFAPCD